jgi:hypothetical protein
MFGSAVRSAANIAVVVAIALGGGVAAMAQQSLPPCLNSKSGTTVGWHNCQGAHALRDKFKSKYVGEWRDGQPGGHGAMVGNGPVMNPRPNGAKFKYVGEFQNGEMHGQGTITGFPNTKKVGYVGGFQHGKFHGQGTLTDPIAGKLVGEWRDGEPHGQGVYTAPGFLGSPGFTYVGEFRNGRFNGKGSMTYLTAGWSDKHPAGEKYVGEFRDGKFHGEGVLYAPDGTIKQAGTWADDEFVKPATVDPAPK